MCVQRPQGARQAYTHITNDRPTTQTKKNKMPHAHANHHPTNDANKQALWQASLALGGIKQAVNIAQLCSASMALCEGDAAKAAKKGK